MDDSNHKILLIQEIKIFLICKTSPFLFAFFAFCFIFFFLSFLIDSLLFYFFLLYLFLDYFSSFFIVIHSFCIFPSINHSEICRFGDRCSSQLLRAYLSRSLARFSVTPVMAPSTVLVALLMGTLFTVRLAFVPAEACVKVRPLVLPEIVT